MGSGGRKEQWKEGEGRRKRCEHGTLSGPCITAAPQASANLGQSREHSPIGTRSWNLNTAFRLQEDLGPEDCMLFWRFQVNSTPVHEELNFLFDTLSLSPLPTHPLIPDARTLWLLPGRLRTPPVEEKRRGGGQSSELPTYPPVTLQS